MIDLWGNQIPEVVKVDRTAAERQARFVAQRSQISQIPDCVNPERREQAEKCLVEFGETYCMKTPECKGIILRKPSELIEQFAKDLQKSIEKGGLKHIRFPRGAGKTSWVKIAILWGLSTGRIKYGLVVAASSPLANAIIRDIWNIIETSVTYGEDFPEIATPVRILEGMSQRAAGQTFDGVRTQIRKTLNEFRLPIIAGAAGSGGILVAKGAGSALRGIVDGSQRPDFVLLDDIQTRQDARSPTRTANLIEWVQQDIMGLGGETLLPIAMTSTPIEPNDFSEQFADAELHPEWETIKYPMVISWPRRTDLWDEYIEIYKCPATRQNANDFYLENRDAMDDGGVVLDPENYDKQREISGLQHAYNLLIRSNKKEAFEAEYQLIVHTPQTMLTVDAGYLATRTNGYQQGVMPAGTHEVVAFLDVMADSIYYSVVAFGPHQTAAIIDYGIYLGKNKRIAPVNASESDLQRLLAAAEHELISRLIAHRYVRDKTAKNIHAIWIDHGWMKAVSTRVCDLYRQRGFPNIYTCAGRSAMYYDPLGKNVVARGHQVDFRETDGVRFAMQNADYWKEVAQRAFYGTPLQPGSVSLWGNDAEVHKEYCEQISNEILTDKGRSARGLEMYKWTLKPGTRNHYLDTLAGCFAMASWYRFWDSTSAVKKGVIEATMKEKKVEAVVHVQRGNQIRHPVRRSRRRAVLARK